MEEKLHDSQAFLQMMYEQHSEWDDIERFQDSPIVVPNAEVMTKPGPPHPAMTPQQPDPKPE